MNQSRHIWIAYVVTCAVNVYCWQICFIVLISYIMKLLEVGVRLDMGGRWVRDEANMLFAIRADAWHPGVYRHVIPD